MAGRARVPASPDAPSARWRSGEAYQPGGGGHYYVRHRRAPGPSTWCGVPFATCVADAPRAAGIFTCWDCLRS